MMTNLRNIAGNDVSIFMFRFEQNPRGIDFVLNEAIAEDMQPDIDAKLAPLVEACGHALMRHKHRSIDNIIMDGNILTTGQFEVMLSTGLGRFFEDDEKARLFQNAKNIADLLSEVMERGSRN